MEIFVLGEGRESDPFHLILDSYWIVAHIKIYSCVAILVLPATYNLAELIILLPKQYYYTSYHQENSIFSLNFSNIVTEKV